MTKCTTVGETRGSHSARRLPTLARRLRSGLGTRMLNCVERTGIGGARDQASMTARTSSGMSSPSGLPVARETPTNTASETSREKQPTLMPCGKA